jgi:hypothetical protein
VKVEGRGIVRDVAFYMIKTQNFPALKVTRHCPLVLLVKWVRKKVKRWEVGCSLRLCRRGEKLNRFFTEFDLKI